jgi:RND superfamily putative drug exporter
MMSMAVSDLRVIGQIGTTIGLGLLFDTLIVRSFMTPSIAALLGRWFWWPQIVRPRPASALLESVGPRPLVRSVLLKQPVQDVGNQPHGLVEHGYRRQVRVPDRLAEARRRPPAAW